jgi:hypothetical protein
MELTSKVIVEKMPILHFADAKKVPEELNVSGESKAVTLNGDEAFVKNWLPTDEELAAMQAAIRSGDADLITIEKQRELMPAAAEEAPVRETR